MQSDESNERERSMKDGEEKEREGGERWVKTEGVMTSFSGCVDKQEKERACTRTLHAEKVRAYVPHCFHMQISWCYYSLFTILGACLSMWIYSRGLKLPCHKAPSAAAVLEVLSQTASFQRRFIFFFNLSGGHKPILLMIILNFLWKRYHRKHWRAK